jgi:hypothetical protein
MSAGHTSVDKDFATAGGIPSSHVETGFLKNASSGVHPVPGHDPLLLASDVAGDLGVERRGKVTQAVVAAFPRRADLALQRVLPPRVKRLTAEGAIPPAVLASSTGRADRQTQAILQTDDKMLVRHGLGLLVLEEDGHLTETASTRTPNSPKINLVVLAETGAQLREALLLQSSGKDTLELGFGLREQTDPIHWLQIATRLSKEFAFGVGDGGSKRPTARAKTFPGVHAQAVGHILQS